jgi:hypothetical protein
MVRSAPFARLRTMLCIAGYHEATQPPSNKPSLAITSVDWQDEAAMKPFKLADDESAALDRFNVSARY